MKKLYASLRELNFILTHTFSYNKTEKLKSKKQLDYIFKKGKSFTVFPIRVLYAHINDEQVLKTGVGVSSRYFKKAVQRNRVKRLLREAYRTEKQPLQSFLNSRQKQLSVFLLFVDKSLPEYNLIQTKMNACIKRLIKDLNETDTENT